MSLDGFIAGTGGDKSWLTEHLGPNPAAEQIMKQTGDCSSGAGKRQQQTGATTPLVSDHDHPAKAFRAAQMTSIDLPVVSSHREGQ
jgi:hypothetical protein